MKTFTYREIWLPIDVNGNGEAVTSEGNAPLIYPGFEYMFRVALFDSLPTNAENPGVFRDVSSIVAFIMRWKQTSYAGTVLLDTSDPTAIAAGAKVEFDRVATEADFVAKTKAPINIYLPKEVTNPTGITSATQQWITFTGASIENAAQADPFGRARLQVIDLGEGATAAPPAAAAADYVRSDIFRAAMQGKVSFGTNPRGLYPVLVNADGSYGVPLRAGPNGEAIMDPIPNP